MRNICNALERGSRSNWCVRLWLCYVMCLCSDGRQKRTKQYATDAELAERLWSTSTDLCKLSTTWPAELSAALSLLASYSRNQASNSSLNLVIIQRKLNSLAVVMFGTLEPQSQSQGQWVWFKANKRGPTKHSHVWLNLWFNQYSTCTVCQKLL